MINFVPLLQHDVMICFLFFSFNCHRLFHKDTKSSFFNAVYYCLLQQQSFRFFGNLHSTEIMITRYTLLTVQPTISIVPRFLSCFRHSQCAVYATVFSVANSLESLGNYNGVERGFVYIHCSTHLWPWLALPCETNRDKTKKR